MLFFLDPSGFMQFVQSVPVAEVLATEGNIQVIRSSIASQERNT